MEEPDEHLGLWKRHFHWRVLLQWEVLGWIVGTLLGVAGILLFFEQFWWSNICFVITSTFAFAKVAQVSITSEDAWWQRMLFTFLLFGLLGLAIVEIVRGVNRFAIRHPDAVETRSKPEDVTSAALGPTVALSANLQPDPAPYSEGTILAGIVWKNQYVDVRLDVATGSTPIQNLDLRIALDTSIAGVGQLSQFPGVIAFPDNSPPAAWLSGIDPQGNPTSQPMAPGPGLATLAPVYRIQCGNAFANTTLHFVIASIALNQIVAGNLPKELFAPRRPPRVIQIKGKYETQKTDRSIEVHPMDFSYDFPEKPSINELKVPDVAKLKFAFWPVDPKSENLLQEVSVPIVDGIVTVAFTAKNVGMLQGNNGQVWIQVCDGCRFAEEPEGSTAPPGDATTRRKRFDAIHKGVYFDPTTLKIIPPLGVKSFTLAFKYTCEQCPPMQNANPQKLRVNITG